MSRTYIRLTLLPLNVTDHHFGTVYERELKVGGENTKLWILDMSAKVLLISESFSLIDIYYIAYEYIGLHVVENIIQTTTAINEGVSTYRYKLTFNFH